MTHSLSTIELAVREAFPVADHAEILKLLNTYGTQPYERERERVQLTIVKICQGDPAKVPYQVEVAKIDYRDILVFADRPLQTADEGAKHRVAAEEVLRRWGKK